MVKIKQKCSRCKTNYVTTSTRSRDLPICFECRKIEMSGEINDPAMKELFDIPEDLYRQSSFLCRVKIAYLRYGQLSENQVAAFKKVALELAQPAKLKKEPGKPRKK